MNLFRVIFDSNWTPIKGVLGAIQNDILSIPFKVIIRETITQNNQFMNNSFLIKQKFWKASEIFYLSWNSYHASAKGVLY